MHCSRGEKKEFVLVFGKALGVGGGCMDKEKCPISASQRTTLVQIHMLRVGIIS